MSKGNRGNNNAKRQENLPKKRLAREMLLAGDLPTRIADELGVSVPSVYRWRRDPEFAKRLEGAHEGRLKCIEDRMRALAVKATDYAEMVLDPARNEDVPHPVRAKVMSEVFDRAGIIGKANVSVIVQQPKVTPEDEAAAMRFIEEQLRAKGWTPPALPEGQTDGSG